MVENDLSICREQVDVQLHQLDLENQGILSAKEDRGTGSTFGKHSKWRKGKLDKVAKQASQIVLKLKWLMFFITHKTNQCLCLRKVLRTNLGTPTFPEGRNNQCYKGKQGCHINQGSQGNQGGPRRNSRRITEILTCKICNSYEHRNFLTCPNFKAFL